MHVINVIDAKLNEMSKSVYHIIYITVYCIYFEARICFYKVVQDTTFSTCLLPVFERARSVQGNDM